jgi:hypothetical protein
MQDNGKLNDLPFAGSKLQRKNKKPPLGFSLVDEALVKRYLWGMGYMSKFSKGDDCQWIGMT